MKMNALRALKVGCLCALTATTAVRASADQATTAPTAPRPSKTYTGIVAAVDPQERALKVKGWLFKKSFSLGDTCSYTFLGERVGTSSDLHPGQKVSVRYQNASGVLVADRVVQQAMRFAGAVKALDLEKRALTVHVRGADKTFQLPQDCRVLLRNDQSGTLADVQPGHQVTVTYEIPYGKRTAQEIAQTSATFTGELTAIDLADRTVKAEAGFESKKFHLVDPCVIVLNGKANAELRDLKPGQKLTFSYNELNGVNVAHRIADATGSAAAMTAGSK